MVLQNVFRKVVSSVSIYIKNDITTKDVERKCLEGEYWCLNLKIKINGESYFVIEMYRLVF